MSIKLVYAPVFVRQFKKLEKNLQDEVVKKIELFKNMNNHETLNVHKLNGRFRKSYGFWIDHKNRIVFDWVSENEAALLMVGDHDIYKKR